MRVQVDGVRLFFEVQGLKLKLEGREVRQRPTVIVLYGGAGSCYSVFGPSHAPLAANAQILYLDNRGAGLSEQGAPSSWTLDQLADDLVAFCTALDIVKPIVLGISFGGFIAMNAAARYPQLMSGVILASTMARFQMQRQLAVFERLGGKEIAAIAERAYLNPTRENQLQAAEHCGRFYSTSPADPDAPFRFRGALDMAAHVVARLPHMDQRQLLPSITCRSLVLSGEDDPLCTAQDGAEIAASLQTNFIRFPNAGHHLHRDAPETYFAAITDFIASQPASPAL